MRCVKCGAVKRWSHFWSILTKFSPAQLMNDNVLYVPLSGHAGGSLLSLWELSGFLATFDTAGEFVMKCGSYVTSC